MYKIIYSSNKTLKEALSEIKQQYGDTEEAKMLLSFASESKRGFSPRVKLNLNHTDVVPEDENN
jgi:acyl-[acyl carrier protein]--UDP-N-acetylglucosamine O-acyltransferase